MSTGAAVLNEVDAATDLAREGVIWAEASDPSDQPAQAEPPQ